MGVRLGSVYRMGVGTTSAQLRAGVARSRDGHTERDFVTPQYAVVYLLEARGSYTDARGRVFPIQPGMLMQRFPSRAHTVRLDRAGLRCYLAVPCQVFELLALMGLASTERPVLDVGVDERWVAGFSDLRDRLRRCDERDFMPLLLRMQRFLVELLEHDRAQRSAAPGGPIARAVQILNEDLSGALALPDVARRVNMGYSAFRKRFTEQIGTAPRDYRIRRRIERAMALLTRDRGRQMKEIAAELGYPDEYAFSAQFKKFAGVAPREFRRRNA